MGIKTYFVELIKGDQAADAKPFVAPVALRGQWVENLEPAPRQLLRALAEAAAMYRDQHIHPQSADGTLPFTLSSIVAHVPEPFLKQVGLGRQPIHVRIANAKQVLGPVFANHAYIDYSELTDWVIQKKATSADDGFEDAYVVSPDSRIGAEFAFAGDFLSEAEAAARKNGRNRVQRQAPDGALEARSEADLPRAMLDYRLIDDTGNDIEKGTMDTFPVTVGRDNSAIAVPRSHKLASGPHVEFSTDAAGRLLVTDVGTNNRGSTNGTWLESGAQLTRLVAATATPLPASGRLILGAGRPMPRAAVLEFSVRAPRPEAPTRAAASHERTIPTEGPSKEPSQMSGAAPPARVAETKITSPRRDGRFGTLALRYSNGDVQTVPIDNLPFTVGRDPELKAEGATVRPSCERVSRRHVQIEDTGKDGFHARNLALDRSGSYLTSIIATEGFFWSFSKPSDPADRWLKLGGDTLDEETVWGRVYPARTK